MFYDGQKADQRKQRLASPTSMRTEGLKQHLAGDNSRSTGNWRQPRHTLAGSDPNCQSTVLLAAGSVQVGTAHR